MKYQRAIEKMLAAADIRINAGRPWDIQVIEPKSLAHIWRHPSLGGGESFMHGEWSCEQLDELFFRITRYLNVDKLYKLSTLIGVGFRMLLYNQQSLIRSTQVAKQHYDLDNQLYRDMLGETMAYTCGYWKGAQNLDQAQQKKYDLVCRKLAFTPGDRVLELGCGWGGFAKFAAERYGVVITAVNISKAQIAWAVQKCQGLSIDFHMADYRDVAIYNPKRIQFDKVVSIGMYEHVGHWNYRQFMKIVHANLKPSGLFLMHTIGKNRTSYFADPWMRKYIFPNGLLPSMKQIISSIENLFVLEDWHNFGSDYDKTLMAWYENFHRQWDSLKQHYDDRFYRMWTYYLLSCAGAFRSRSIQLWQCVMSPNGKLNGYFSIR